MAARIGILVLTGGVLLGIAAAVVVRNQPEKERRPHTAAPSPLACQPDAGVSGDREESMDDVTGPADAPPPYETMLIKSTATFRHWRVDPREVREIQERPDRALPGLILSANFGGGVRVENPGDLRWGVTRDLEKGDVVRDINGFAIQDEGQFQLLATRLWRKTGVIRATIDRGGSPVQITYQRADAPLPPATFR